MPWFVLRLYALKDRLLSREIPPLASGGRKLRPRRRLRAGALLAFMGVFLLAGRPAHAGLDVDKIVQTFAELAFSIVGALMKAIVLVIDILIPIMTYNNFVDNPVVKAGWAIVRDTVNMFFVVILIIIAFGTIFGHKRFQWSQQVPRLLIVAVVINFSKTLCGIMIDFGQVIMLTFANALREIAAGNFIQLLGLNKTYQISQTSEAIQNISSDPAPATLQAFDFFAAGIISVGMTMFVLSTLIVLAAILLFRIIMLWILVVMAPLAWFVKGAEGIIESNAYKEWWSEFKCLVGVGPILTFFLWLTLTVAGAGNIAVNSGFDVSTGNSADFTSAGLEPTNFLSFLIGAAMLIAGWKAAAQFCSGVSGQFLGKMSGAAKSLTKGALIGAPVAASALALKGTVKGTQLGMRGLAATPAALASVARKLPGSAKASRAVGAARESVKTNIWKGVEGLGKKTGIRTLEQAGIAGKGKAKAQAGIARMEGVNKATEKLKGQDRETNLNLMKQYAKNVARGGKLSTNEEAEYLALMDMTMGDSRMQKAARKDGTLQQAWSQMGSQFERMNAHDSAKTDQVRDFKKSNAHIATKGMNSAEKEEFLKEHLMGADDMKGLVPEAWEDQDIQRKAEGIQTTFIKDGKTLNALEAARAGFYGDKEQQAVMKGTDVTKLNVGSEMETQFEVALRGGDQDSADAVVAQMESRYKDTKTSDQEREQMARSMDRMRAAAQRLASKGNTTAGTMLPVWDTWRAGLEGAHGFGEPPAPKTGESGENYVAENFGHANTDRIDNATSHFSGEESRVSADVATLDAELARLKTDDKATNDAVAQKRQQIEAVRSRIEESTKPEVNAAFQDLRAARKLLEEAQKSGDAGEIALGTATVADAQTAYTAAQASAQTEVDDDPEIKALEADISTLVTAAGSTRGDEIARKSAELADLKAEAKRLEEVRKALEEEKKKR